MILFVCFFTLNTCVWCGDCSLDFNVKLETQVHWESVWMWWWNRKRCFVTSLSGSSCYNTIAVHFIECARSAETLNNDLSPTIIMSKREILKCMRFHTSPCFVSKKMYCDMCQVRQAGFRSLWNTKCFSRKRLEFSHCQWDFLSPAMLC